MNKNIILQDNPEKFSYSPINRPQEGPSFPVRQRREHADRLGQKLSHTVEEQIKQQDNTCPKKGYHLEVIGEPGFTLETKSIENQNIGTKLLNIRTFEVEGEVLEKATVYLPENHEDKLLKKLKEYRDENTPSGNPKNNKLVVSISDINQAFLESFWTSNSKLMPQEEKIWCEIWTMFDEDNNNEEELRKICILKEIEIKKDKISFPEREVFLIRANKNELEEIVNSSSYLAEIRKTTVEVSFFTDLENTEQVEWAEDLKKRIRMETHNNIYISLLDTGVNKGHLLLEDIIEDDDLHTIFENSSKVDNKGHGTAMSGILAYKDIKEILTTSSEVMLTHNLESIKVLPDEGENEESLYGAIIEEAISNLIINDPDKCRIFCMPITSPADPSITEHDGTPSSWSASIDKIAKGVPDDTEKLMIISAGNISDFSTENYYSLNILSSVEDPGQSWNALTVGAYTELNEAENYEVLAQRGEISPYSRTSSLWESKWPIKPEVVEEGGNLVVVGENAYSHENLSVITTDKSIENTFTIFNATSASTASTAWIAAKIQNEYPGLWPETVRGLIVHSANWTEKMKEQFMNMQKLNKTEYAKLLRAVGYGVPNLNDAIYTLDNRVNMVLESEIQPFTMNNGNTVINEMHLHKLPWPKETLEDLQDTEVTLRITLSYFIDPAPGNVGWKDKYRYASHGLRFDINGNADEEEFLKKVNQKARTESDRGGNFSNNVKWSLGQARNTGSVHSDWWTGSASELALNNYIAVYPVSGWWKERKHLKKWDSKARYSLIVTLSTPEEEVNLRTPILSIIRNTSEIEV